MSSSRAALSAAWLAAVAGIVALSIYGRGLQLRLFVPLGEARGALVVGALVLALVATIGLVARRRGAAAALRAAALAPLLALGLWLIPMAEERLHFLVFGGFGALTFALLTAGPATIVAVAFAVGDEILQGALPDRVFDVRDIAMNSASALAAGWLLRGESR